ncbi:hypothetical protein ACIRYZ_14915 [Kitasatospora sp. NPDC101155]|uniref:hypothetical protein n=1 Tax=Kitasatospora sp. NPDC101155 TaxID=3364097 RepID=UPI0037F7401F
MLTTMRRLRRECERKLADLPLPEPFTIEGLVAAMEEVSGRTIKLVPLDDRGSDLRTACGLRMRADGLSLIFYRPRPTQNQTDHVRLHELVHEWFDHGTSLDEDALRLLLPEHLRQGLVERMGHGAVVQARARYDTREEREAELSASLIKRIVRRQFPAGSGGDMVSLLESTLSHPVAAPRRGRK